MIDLSLNLAGDYSDSGVSVVNGDFNIRNGKFYLVDKDDIAYQVGQRLHVRLLMRRGEVFFNTQAGFPYVDISKFKRQSGIFDTYMKSYIIATDGVKQLTSYQSANNAGTRVEDVRFGVLVADNQVVNIVQEIDV